MVMESDPAREGAQLTEELLRGCFGEALSRSGEGRWRVREEQLWVQLVQTPTGDALEIVLPTADLGYEGRVPPTLAAELLRSMVHAHYVRCARRAHPNGSGTLALVLAATAYLEDLDVAELAAVATEMERLVQSGA